MQEVISNLKELFLSPPFWILLLCSSSTFASRKAFVSSNGKEALAILGRGWILLYFLHLYLNFIVLVASYIGLVIQFGVVSFIIVFILLSVLSLPIRKKLITMLFEEDGWDTPLNKIGKFFKIITVSSLVGLMVYILIIYQKYF